MANFGKAFGDPAKKYAANIAVEQITKRKIQSDSYSNSHMDRGHQQEPLARQRYEEEFFCEVLNGGFFSSGNTGASPDGLVGANGLIEIKSAIPSVHVKRVKSGTYDPAYKWQLIGNLRITDREWIDFISYCSDFPEDKQIYVRRLYADKVIQEMAQIDIRLGQFWELVDEIKNTINCTAMIVTDKAS